MYQCKSIHSFLLNGLKHNIFFIRIRHLYTKKEKAAMVNIKKAFDYYDSVCPPIYGPKKWLKMKKALLEEAKYASIINNFTDHDYIIQEFEDLGAYDVGAFYAKRVKDFEENFPDLKSLSESYSTNTPNSKELRPSLIQLTDDEKAEAASKDEGRYPEEFKNRVIDKLGGLQDFDSNSSRLIKGSQLVDSTTSFAFDHVPPTKLKGLDDWVEEADVFSGMKNTDEDFGAKKIMEKEPIKWPKNLKVYSFVKGDVDVEFPSPLPSKVISAFTHYLLNGSSILPVLALDIQRGNTVLDMCAGPGGKSLAILQTQLPSLLVCNDISRARVKRVQNVLGQYIPKVRTSVWESIDVTNNPGQMVMNPNFFDRVLVDAPCLNDRFSLQESDNNIFKTGRLKERLNLPEIQAELIVAALQFTKPGGCVVYSTCTLSPLQNDGAVHLALTKIWRETKIDCTVVNMMPTLKNLNFMYNIGHDQNLRYGHLILPFVDNNYGPMYVCKIIRDR